MMIRSGVVTKEPDCVLPIAMPTVFQPLNELEIVSYIYCTKYHQVHFKY